MKRYVNLIGDNHMVNKNKYNHTKDKPKWVKYSDVEHLESENKRLRKALEEILKYESVSVMYTGALKVIVNKALKPKGD